LSNVIGGYRFSEQDFEDLFIEFYLVNGYTPIASELGKNGLPTTATIRRRFNLTHNEFLDEIGLPKNKISTKPKSREEMINDLQRLEKELGRTPVTEDLIGREDIKGKGSYESEFGTWTNALVEAGIKPIWRPLTDDELINELKRFFKENGRSPTIRNQLEYGWTTFSNRFGSWNNALTAAGLSHNDSIYGVKTEGKDGFIYDSISESIVANWLYDNGIDYEPHVPYHRELIADFKSGEYFIEFFGLHHDEEYMRKVKLKQRLCEKKGYKLISLFQDDLSKLDEKLEVLINDSEELTTN